MLMRGACHAECRRWMANLPAENRRPGIAHGNRWGTGFCPASSPGRTPVRVNHLFGRCFSGELNSSADSFPADDSRENTTRTVEKVSGSPFRVAFCHVFPMGVLWQMTVP